MDCPHCEAKLPDDVEVCLVCGKLVRPGNRPPPARGVAKQRRSQPSFESFARRPRIRLGEFFLKALVVLIPALVLLGIAVFVFRDRLRIHMTGFEKIAESFGR